MIRGYRDAGVRHIVALRGDPVGGVGERYAPHPGGYENGADLVAGIKRIAPTSKSRSRPIRRSIPTAPTVEADIDMLKAKVDAGATRAMTQFFFENDLYFRYLDRVRARGIDVPIVPGILPVQNFKQTKNFAERCGASVPDWLAERFDGLDDDRRDPQADRRRGRRRAGARPGRSRRHRLPLLHHEPRRPRLRDLPPARAAARGAGGGVSKR